MRLDQLIALKTGVNPISTEKAYFLSLICKIKEVIGLYKEVQFIIFLKWDVLSTHDNPMLTDVVDGVKYPNWIVITGLQSLFFYIGLRYQMLMKISLFSIDKSFLSMNFEEFMKTHFHGNKIKRFNHSKFYECIVDYKEVIRH